MGCPDINEYQHHSQGDMNTGTQNMGLNNPSFVLTNAVQVKASNMVYQIETFEN